VIKGKASEEGKGRGRKGGEKGQKISMRWYWRSLLRIYELDSLTSFTFFCTQTLWFSLL